MSKFWYAIVRFRIAILGIFAIVVLLTLAVVIVLHIRASESLDTPSRARNEFIHQIQKEGGVRAYAAFVETYRPQGFEIQHNAAHLFGEALYDVEHLGGLAICDQTFNFGCYHGFMSRAIAREGLPVIHKLDGVCKSDTLAPMACQHGIGHGILEFLGHTKLLEALDACKLTNQEDPIAGCTSGVFMEYNVPLVTREDGSIGVESRSLADAHKPFDVCPSMPAQFKQSCYHELPQWWTQVLTTDMGDMGRLCATVEEEQLKNACLMGVSNIIPSQAAYDAQTIISMCNEMPTPKSIDECLVGAAWGLVKNFHLNEAGTQVCKTASAGVRHQCPI